MACKAGRSHPAIARPPTDGHHYRLRLSGAPAGRERRAHASTAASRILHEDALQHRLAHISTLETLPT